MGWQRVFKRSGVLFLAILLALPSAPARADTSPTATSCRNWVHKFADFFSGTRNVRRVHYPDGTSAWEVFRLFGIIHKIHVRQPNGVEVTYNRTNRTFQQLSSELLYPPELLTIPQGARMLDVGCGGGNIVESLRGRGIDAVGSDIILSTWQRKRSHYVEAQGHRLPFREGEFDVVYSTWSFLAYEGWRQDAAGQKAVVDFLGELGRVTKPGGVIRLSPVPFKKFVDASGQLQVAFPEMEAALKEVPRLKVHQMPNPDWLTRHWYTPTADPRDLGMKFEASVWIELISEW
jgi:SAM-dependent methyltransferase